MSRTTEAGPRLDHRDLLLYLHALPVTDSTVDRTLHLALRAMQRHFDADSAVVARLDADETPSGKQYRYPKRPKWPPEQLVDLRASALADLPRPEIFALLERKHRVWAIAALRRREQPFRAPELELLKEAARVLSGHLQRFDRNRAVALRARIDRKLIEPIRPSDFFYQVLHGLRSLTGYDHSASLYMLSEPVPLPCDSPFPIDLQIVAELLGPSAKSPRVGQEREIDPAVLSMLGESAPFRCRRDGEEWRTRSGRRGAEIASVLDSHGDLGDYGREGSLICAPLVSENALVGLLKIGFRHAGMAGSYETDLVREFVPHFIVALRNLRRLEHLRGELEAARRFQASLLPPTEHRLREGSLTYRYRPCDELGGDFFDLVSTTPGRTTLLLADVSGHGAKASMLTALVKATFRDGSAALDPAAILDEIWSNVRYLDPELMVTAFCLELDWEAQVMRWANAGHPAPLVRLADGRQERIEEGDPPIFACVEFPRQLHERPLPRGARMLLYTDGLAEAERSPADEFGEERLKGILARDLHSAPVLLDRLFAAVDEYRPGRQADDYTAVVLDLSP